MAILWVWVAALVTALVLYFRKTYSRFSDYGVKQPHVVPFFGNMFRILFRLEHISEERERIYNTFPGERFVGRYELVRPTLVIRDLELVKKITIKDFEYFIDHRSISDANVEPLFARNLFALKGQEWKDMRSTLSPAFTSSKIKLMVPFMEEVGVQMIRALTNKIKESETDYIKVDCKDLTSRYTNDVIATCAFGLKVDSYTNENNQFYNMGRLTSIFSFRQVLVLFAFSTFPSLAKKLNLTFLSKTTKEFFLDIVLNTMRDREVHKIIRPDMIHLLMEAKKGKLKYDDKASNENQKDTGFSTVEESSIGKNATNINKVWSDVDLVAQAVLFFIAGFETISSAMIFALYELAVNPKVQERLVQEIKDHDANYGKLDFNSIQYMTYMDMVVSEVLRLWPPAIDLDRICVKDYNLGKPNSKSSQDFIIRKGEAVLIPVWSFHRDPNYFPNPLRFDPERFSEENKHTINPVAYMPFGMGPRNCIGSRFALCELKIFLYQILLHLEVSPSESTRIPAKMSTESFQNRHEGGHWLRFKIRN